VQDAVAGEVAAFDFDGTITRGDTLVPFLQRLCGTRAVVAAFARHSVSLARAAAGLADRDEAKAAVLATLLAGHQVGEIEELIDAYSRRIVNHQLRPAVLERVEWHRDRGHYLVMVSASPELYVSPTAGRLGFDAVLATRLETTDDGRLSGYLTGANVRGPEKVRSLHAHLGGPPTRLWAYGNSSGDRELLAAADVAVLVSRRGTLEVQRGQL